MICRTKSKIWDVIVLREVCVRFRYLLPFPSLSHRFDHEIREDRATQEVNPFIKWDPQSGPDGWWWHSLWEVEGAGLPHLEAKAAERHLEPVAEELEILKAGWRVGGEVNGA